jgi:hypothetical protein
MTVFEAANIADFYSPAKKALQKSPKYLKTRLIFGFYP